MVCCYMSVTIQCVIHRVSISLPRSGFALAVHLSPVTYFRKDNMFCMNFSPIISVSEENIDGKMFVPHCLELA